MADVDDRLESDAELSRRHQGVDGLDFLDGDERVVQHLRAVDAAR